jgi:hypothetical protein
VLDRPACSASSRESSGLTPAAVRPGLLSLGISLLGVTRVPKVRPAYAEIVGAYKVACSRRQQRQLLRRPRSARRRASVPTRPGAHLLDVGLTWKTMVDVVRRRAGVDRSPAEG